MCLRDTDESCPVYFWRRRLFTRLSKKVDTSSRIGGGMKGGSNVREKEFTNDYLARSKQCFILIFLPGVNTLLVLSVELVHS